MAVLPKPGPRSLAGGAELGGFGKTDLLFNPVPYFRHFWQGDISVFGAAASGAAK